MKNVRKAMGGGVESLFTNSRVLQDFDDATKELMQVHVVSINRISPNAEQPRKYFSEDSLVELEESIEEHGILQPLVVKPSQHTTGAYTIIAGERRYRAAKEIGLKEVPVIIRDVELKEALVLALTENMQRENLNPCEEADALYSLKEHFGFTQEELAQTLGKSRSTIANLLRLMNLCEEAKEAIKIGSLSLGHAKVLLSVSDKEQQKEILSVIVERSYSVREAEAFIELCKKGIEEESTTKKKQIPSHYMKEIAKQMSERFATKVHLKGTEEKGSIVISFTSKEMLDSLLHVLNKEY